MEIGKYEEHGIFYKIKFKIPRKLKKKFKNKLGDDYSDYKNYHVIKIAHSIKERHFYMFYNVYGMVSLRHYSTDLINN